MTKIIRRDSLTLVILLAATSTPGLDRACAQDSETSVTWPNTPAGRRAQDYFIAYEIDTDEAMQQFVERNYSSRALKEKPARARVAENRKIRKQLGRLEIADVQINGELGLDVTAQSTNAGAWLKFTVTLEPAEPHFWIEMVGRPSKAPNRPRKTYDRWDKLSELAETVRRDIGAPAIAIAVGRTDKIAESVVLGAQSADGPKPVLPGDRFHIGSIGKSFTATMIARLVERGVVKWDTSIASALTDVPMKPEYKSVTLEQLLRHRGGLSPMPTTGEFETDIAPAGRTPLQGRGALVKQVLGEPPMAKPGTRKIYSNAGYVVAATMAERATKKTWEDLMREEVFSPLKLETACVGWPATAQSPDQPRGHSGIPPKLKAQELGQDMLGGIDLAVFIAPAGHISCSVDDLARFGIFHLQGLAGKDGALKSSTVRALHVPGPAAKSENGYAAGWVVSQTAGGKPKHSHSGSGGTFYASLSIYPDSGLVIAVATNVGIAASESIDALTEAIQKKYTP